MKNRKKMDRNDKFAEKVTDFFKGSGCLENLTRARKWETEILGELEFPERLNQFIEIVEDFKLPISRHAKRTVDLARRMLEVNAKIEKRRAKKRERFARR